MKKTFFYFFAVLFLGSLFLASCEPKPNVDSNKDQTEQPNDSTGVIPDEPNDTTSNAIVLPEGTIRLQALKSEYNLASNLQISGATHSFLLMFATEECEVIYGTPFGNGKVLVMDLFSETAENLLPAEGIYKIEEAIQDGSITAGFDMMGVPIGTYVQNMVDGEFVSHDFIVSGAVEIKKGKADDEVDIFVYAVFEDGSEANYYYGGKLLITDYSVEE